ncbi:MAG: PSD1 and planctomycete cytochrome C domain-containing protein, partial [Verrucomicrobiota bacterium]
LAEPSAGDKLFALHIKPLFAEKCNACHGDDPDKIKGGFDMRTRDSLLLGGDTFGEETAMLGKGEQSFLYITTTRKELDYEMPPKEADKLSEEEQWHIRDWLNAGAPWPNDEAVAAIQAEYAEGEVVQTSKALSEDWQNRRYESDKLWAYRPVKVAAVPEGMNPVDHFINESLSAVGLEAAGSALPKELVRRIHFGLTGLPPSPELVTSFMAEPDVESLVTDLMDSPHYGEQFAQHWLDVARYADSGGFANDYARPNAWRYRDYVVRAFNEDKPYDQFVREQIAGDELDANDSENLIATGFLRMGPWEQTGMSVFKETRQMWLDDVTDSVGQTFLAHAMQCAKCHDHKFDPVPTRDYYRMMAVFSTTQFADRDAPFLESESKAGFDQRNSWTKAKLSYFQDQQNAINAKISQNKQAEGGDVNLGENGLGPGDEASQTRLFKNVIKHKIEQDSTRPVAQSVYTGKTVTKRNVQGRQKLPKKPWGAGEFDPDVIFTGGDVYTHGDAVVPGALSAAESLGGMQTKSFPKHVGKRRLALADWITDSQNPLAARVMVNRVWSWHFGQGLAGNPNNFGGTGELPTHPELLDYLAAWFIESGWSVKALNHLIMSSEAYQRSSTHSQPHLVEEKDPKQKRYATFRPRRLTAEQLRDAMLVSSGELNRAVGGIPCRPEINAEVALQPRQIMGGTASVYEPDPTPEQRNRRSLYAERIRGLRDPFLETFNQPGPDNSCELRETSTVAPQALTMMNAQEVQDRGLAFADRLVKLSLTEEQTVAKAFEIALGRAATEQEVATCV